MLKAEPEDVIRAVHLARKNKNFLERVRKRHREQKQERMSRPLEETESRFGGADDRSTVQQRLTQGGRTGRYGRGFMIPHIRAWG